jgi:ubiquinone/menaquinone biosynthesis C-methylase UbiE
LELAVGTGRLTQLIVELGFAYTGIDTSQEFLSFARDKYKTYSNKAQFFVPGYKSVFSRNRSL